MKNFIFFLFIALLSALFVYFRLDHLDLIRAMNGYSSDTAIYMLMAEEIFNLERLPIFFYGQNYMGPLTSIFVALNQVALNILDIKHMVPYFNVPYTISPVAAVLACMEMILIGNIFFSLAVKRLFGIFAALVTFILVGFGSPLFSYHSLRPNGAEMAFLMGPIVLYLFVVFMRDFTSSKKFLFGLVVGFGWWMNQTIVFLMLPMAFYLFAQTDEYKEIRNNINLKQRFFLTGYNLHSKLRGFLLFVHWVLLINLIYGLICNTFGSFEKIILGVRIKMSSGTGPIKTSVLVFVGIQFLIWLFKNEKAKATVKRYINILRYFGLGFIIGYFPVLFGVLLGWYEKNYGVKFRLIEFYKVPSYWRRLIHDFIPRLYLDLNVFIKSWWSGYLATTLLVLLLIVLIRKNKSVSNYLSLKDGQYSLKSLIPGAIFFNLVYVFLSARTQDQYGLRYAILSVPAFYATMSYLSFHKNKFIKSFSIIWVILGLVIQIHYFKKTVLNQYTEAPKIELRELKKLSESTYNLCYANFWDSYKYEYFSQHKVEFIVYQDQVRTKKLNKQRMKRPGAKCYFETGKPIVSFKEYSQK